ncbi:G:T/U mismatch-specific uracil/thymine DNA-glycosylase [Hydrogenimonas sp.]|nr:G:T/U mismatch-specific uracil/thymine DNA-glycosylase [Hydrogenimonas sp.]
MQKTLHPFPPIIDSSSKVLILGSFPSIKSFEESFYYAHPRNQFWPILSALFDMPAKSREERLKLLGSAKIALWDVVAGCERTDSSDAGLRSCEPNDIPALLERYPNIEAILFTGRKAESLFKKHFGKDTDLPLSLLPSPSPAYAAMSFDEKLRIWRETLYKLLF